jgi:hypothetical protein
MRRRGRLGELLQDAMANGRAADVPPARRRPWAYVLGAIGAGLVCVGALLLFVVMLSPVSSMSGAAVKAGGGSLFGGATILGIAWVAMLGTGRGGLLAIVASFAVPAGIAYFYVHFRDAYESETTVAVMGLGFGAFAGGHLFACGIHGGVRALAAVTMMFVIVAFSAEAQHWSIAPRTLGHLYEVAFAGLAATALALALDLSVLARAER